MKGIGEHRCGCRVLCRSRGETLREVEGGEGYRCGCRGMIEEVKQ